MTKAPAFEHYPPNGMACLATGPQGHYSTNRASWPPVYDPERTDAVFKVTVLNGKVTNVAVIHGGYYVGPVNQQQGIMTNLSNISWYNNGNRGSNVADLVGIPESCTMPQPVVEYK